VVSIQVLKVQVVRLITVLFIALGFSATVNAEERSMIIDVRTIEEWNAGHLADAIHLPIDRLEASIAELVEDKHQTVYLYCRSGHRSGIGATVMETMGYTAVTNAGGLAAAAEALGNAIVQ